MKTKSTTQNKVERVFKAIATVILLQKYVQVEMESASLTTHHCLLKFRLWLLSWDRHTINFDIILGFLSSFVYNADVSVLHAVCHHGTLVLWCNKNKSNNHISAL